MKLEKILSLLNSLEKNSFLKIIDNIISNSPKNQKEIEKILEEGSRELKEIDDLNIARIFNLVEDEFCVCVKEEFVAAESQLDIISDILTRDGNCIAKQDWFARLYEKELQSLEKKTKTFTRNIKDEKSDIEPDRRRDYDIYRACIITAYKNDDINNQERKITTDEQSILITLSRKLELSQEEQKLINYSVLPIEKKEIEDVINELRHVGIAFYSRKQNTVYVPQEIVRILRNIRGKEIADKYFRRVLFQLREPLINKVCRKHNIDWKMSFKDKVEAIIAEGIKFSSLLSNSIFKEDTTLTERKKFINELCDKKLSIRPSIKGVVLEEKIENLIEYFNELELDERVTISYEGYEKLVRELGKEIPEVNSRIKQVFSLQEKEVLDSKYLLDYNIKPQDILEIISDEILEGFVEKKGIKKRGDIRSNILDSYKDAENLYIENFENIAFRNYKALKENDIELPEAELGSKFEELTKLILTKLGFNVDEDLRKKINTKKDKIDIIINLGNKDIILVECKSVKESGYNKFSSVYRQLKAYRDQASKKDFKVIKSLLIAPEFTDDFLKDCELEYELNLSLITASSLVEILNGFKNADLKQLPYKLLMRDVLIQSDRILKAIT